MEKKLAAKRTRLAELEARLADESMYTDPDRKEELTRLIQDEAAVRSDVESLEEAWLEASETLEQAT